MKEEINPSNILTTLRLILGPAVMYYILNSQNNIALSLFIVAIITDFFDGNLARRRNEVTRFGEILDSISDKMLYAFALLGIFIKNNMLFWIVILASLFFVYAVGYIFFIKKRMKKSMVGKISHGISACFIILMIMSGIVNNYTISALFIFMLVPMINYLRIMLRGRK